VDLDADHRRHALVELAIRDLKENSGLAHCPSGRLDANATWLVLAALAHNLLRCKNWSQHLDQPLAGAIMASTAHSGPRAVRSPFPRQR